jgi:hypothetical protein
MSGCAPRWRDEELDDMCSYYTSKARASIPHPAPIPWECRMRARAHA